MNKIRWLLVGAGDISKKRVAPALVAAKGSELVAICDVHQENARTLAKEFSIDRVYTDLTEALNSVKVDAVYLATPVYLHTQHAHQVLQAGKHVLVEKPLSLTGADGVRLVQAAKESGKTAGCAYYRRFFPAYLMAKEMLAAGQFGQIALLRMLYYSWFGLGKDDPKYWRVEKAKSGGGPLSDMGSHMLDLMIGLFDLPVSVYAWCDNLLHPEWDVEDNASILMKLRNGAQVTATFSWCSKTWRHEFEIVGTEAKVNWFPYDSGEVTKTTGRQVEALKLPPGENVHLPLVQDFIDAVLENRPPVCPFDEAVKTNLLLDAIYQSASENRKVSLY
jgi:1,5-anhydro-D-fructose reductase (1,5-anhydro-D-mannitol-forming)